MAGPLVRVSQRLGPYITPVPTFEAHANPLRTLVREAAQNSWDARNPNAGRPPLFRIDVRELHEPQAVHLRALLGDGDVAGLPGFDRIRPGAPMIIVHDRHTLGLDGDLRRSENEVGGRWWRFVGNYGDRALADAAGPGGSDTAGGGSFGLGKLACFGAAASRLVVIHSHVRTDTDEIEARFLVYGIGNTVTEENHTGRHWWGRSDRWMGEEIPLPVIGAEADRLATALDLPAFEGEATGTTLAIVDAVDAPRLDGDGDVVSRPEFIRECILWNLWPKLLAGESQMDVRLFHEESEVDLREPEDDEIAKHFVRAYSAALADAAPEGMSRSVVSYRNRGVIAVGAAIDAHVLLADERRAALVEAAGGPSLPLRHVMLTRDPRLVVSYLPVIEAGAAEEHPVAAVALPPAGATATIAELGLQAVDKVLRRAEPEAHDAWDPQRTRLATGERSFVQHVVTKVRASVAEMHTAPAAERAGDPNIGLGRRLAEHFITTGRLYPPPPPKPTRQSERRPKAQLGPMLDFRRGDRRVVSEHEVEVGFASYGAVAVTCAVSVVTEGGGLAGGGDDGDAEIPIATWVVGAEEYAADTAVVCVADSPDPLRLRIERASWHRVAATFKAEPSDLAITEGER